MSGGRSQAIPVRVAEAKAARRIIEQKLAKTMASSVWIMASDLNDYINESG